jgi:hypothetical protein
MPRTVTLESYEQEGRIYTGEIPDKLIFKYPEGIEVTDKHRRIYYDGRDENGKLFNFESHLNAEDELVKTSENLQCYKEVHHEHQFGLKKDGSVHYRWTRVSNHTQGKYICVNGPKVGILTHDPGDDYALVNRNGQGDLPKAMWVYVPQVQAHLELAGVRKTKKRR